MSESNKFTPGPWVTEKSDSNGIACVATADNLLEICEVWGNSENGINIDDESMANATLIAAAPDLLEALEGMISLFPTGVEDDGAGIGFNETLKQKYRNAVIASKKARGQQ